MHFNTIFAVAATFATSLVSVHAAPNRLSQLDGVNVADALAKRAGTTEQYVQAFHDGKDKLTPILDKLNTDFQGVEDKNDGNAVIAAVGGDLTDVDNVIKDVQTEVQNLRKRMFDTVELIERQEGGDTNNTAVAEAIAEFIEALLNALDALEDLAESNPVIGALLAPFFSAIDADLAVILTGLGLVLSGVLALVADLLSALGGALGGLGGASSGALGL